MSAYRISSPFKSGVSADAISAAPTSAIFR